MKGTFLITKGTFLIIIKSIFEYIKNVPFQSYRCFEFFTYNLDDAAALQFRLFNLWIFSFEMYNILAMKCIQKLQQYVVISM